MVKASQKKIEKHSKKRKRSSYPEPVVMEVMEPTETPQLQIVQGNCGSTSNKLQQNLFYRAIDKVDELNNILKVPKNPIGGTC